MRKIVLLCIAMVMMVSCKKEEYEEGGDLKLRTETLELAPNMTRKLNFNTPSGEPFVGGYSDTLSLNWKSEDESIAIVDNKGRVTGKSVGQTKIIAQSKKHQWTCNITVSNNIPFDPVLKKYLLTNGYDTNNDGEISVEEAKLVSEIKFSNYSSYTNYEDYVINSLDGIELLPQLKRIDTVYVSVAYPSSLDLTKNPLLEYVNFSRLYNYEKIIIGQNENLKHFECFYGSLKSLDLTGCSNLEYLRCLGNEITSIDLTNCLNLKYIDCSDNKISSLYFLTNSLNLEYLHCSENDITSIDLKNNLKLKELYFSENPIENLNLKENTNLELLACNHIPLTNLDLGKNIKLRYLHCILNDSLTSIILSKPSYDAKQSGLFYIREGSYIEARFDLPYNAVISVAE